MKVSFLTASSPSLFKPGPRRDAPRCLEEGQGLVCEEAQPVAFQDLHCLAHADRPRLSPGRPMTLVTSRVKHGA